MNYLSKLLVGLVIILFLLGIFVFYKRMLIHNLSNIDLDYIYNYSRTGDLILFRWHEISYYYDFVSSFTHVGMIFEHQNKKYILETHLKGDTDHMGYYDKGGVNIYELRNRINMYEGYNFYLKLNDNNRIFDLHKKIPIYKNISFNDKYKKHFLEYCLPKKICETCFTPMYTESMFCSQLVGNILKDNNIIDNDNIDLSCVTPHDFLNIENKYGKIYDKLYKINK